MSFFKKILKLIAIVLAIIMIVALIIAAFMAIFSVAPFMVGGIQITVTKLVIVAAIAGIVSAVISPEGFDQVVTKVADGAKRVSTSVGNIVTEAAEGLGKGIISSVTDSPLLMGGIVAVLLWSRRSSTKKTAETRRQLEKEKADANSGSIILS